MGIVTSEFVITVRRDLIRLLKLAEKFKGSVTYSDTASNFVRLRFRGQPCSSEFINNVIEFLRESRDLIKSCRCLSTYVTQLGTLRSVGVRELTSVRSCVTECVTIDNKVLCEKRTEDANLLLEILKTFYSLKIRAYPVSAGEHATPTLSSLRQAIQCDDSLIRKLLSIMCELEKCLSGV